MLRKLTGAIVALASLFGVAVQSVPASAMPMVDRAPAAASRAASGVTVDQVRWVCGPYRCFHRPNRYYGYRRHFYRPVYYRPIHRWHRPHFYRPVYGYGYRHAYRHRPYGYYNPYRRHFRHYGYYRPHRWHHRGWGYGYRRHHWHHRHFYRY